MGWSAFGDKWLSRASGVATFVAPATPGTIGAIVSGFLSTSVVWIRQFGWFGWWSAALIGFVLASSGYALIGVAKERLAHARAIKVWSAEVDGINPLDTEFHKKRISLTDMRHPADGLITGKKFTDCQLIGPVVIAIMNNVTINGIGFLNCDLVPTKSRLFLANGIGINHCQFIGGSICNATIFVHPDVVTAIESSGMGPYYPSLTGNPVIDAREPPR